jgi:hypothetical protein
MRYAEAKARAEFQENAIEERFDQSSEACEAVCSLGLDLALGDSYSSDDLTRNFLRFIGFPRVGHCEIVFHLLHKVYSNVSGIFANILGMSRALR